MNETNQHELDDRQILQEVVTNEKIVNHPTLGDVRLKIPTLEIQRKIDSIARAKKKYLKDAKDEIPDQEDSTKVKLVPAFKSREMLAKEYEELGWWTIEDKNKLDELTQKHISLLAQLELLGFESEEDILADLGIYKDRLMNLFTDDLKDNPNLEKAIIMICVPGTMIGNEDTTIIKNAASTTEVDDILDGLGLLHRQYRAYVELAGVYSDLVGIQSQYSSLFSDSWQEQLQYYIRLAQVFYCAEKVGDKKPIWASVDDLEKEKDVSLVRWVFEELTAFWQGIPDELRRKISKYGFTSRQNIEKQSTEDSLVLPISFPDGEPQEKKLEISSGVLDIVIPSPTINLISSIGS